MTKTPEANRWKFLGKNFNKACQEFEKNHTAATQTERDEFKNTLWLTFWDLIFGRERLRRKQRERSQSRRWTSQH